MSCLLTVRACDALRQWELDEWTVLVVLAGLSAEPETLDELAAAVRRYQPEHGWFDSGKEVEGVEHAATDGSAWCLVDLIGRTVVGSGFELPDPDGAYQTDDDEDVEGFLVIWLNTPADWTFIESAPDWPRRVAQREQARVQRSRVDARAVLYGQPLLQYVNERVRADVVERGTDERRRLERIRAIHAEWLMTARDDLGGRTPRQLLLADRNRIQRDLEHRSRQWTMQGHAPPALEVDSTAYRLGGFGTAEVVLYFDLVRCLLHEAADQIQVDPALTPELLVRRLANRRDQWLATPDEDSSDQLTPAELIESERRRMPVTDEGTHLHDDCPICQAMEHTSLGPAFMWFDGHHLELEDEFAFSLTESRQEWQREQAGIEQYCEEVERPRAERQSTDAAHGPGSKADSVWQTSYVDWDQVGGPEGSPLSPTIAIAFPLAELVSDLQQRPDGQDHIQAVNGAYRDFRQAQDVIAARSAAERFGQQLEAIALAFPEMVGKSADLQSRLDEVLRLATS